MPERYTATVRAEALSPELVAATLPKRPIPGTRYRVTLEPVEETDAEKLAALRAGVDRGRAEIAAGLGIDGETVFADLKQRFCK